MSKNVLLIENRPKQMIVTSLNLNIYLNSDVHSISSLEDLSDWLKSDKKIDLIISSESFNAIDISLIIDSELRDKYLKIPHLLIGNEEGQILLDDKLIIKPILKESAVLLGLTPKMMASLEVSEFYKITSGLIQYLDYAPCDIYISDDNKEFKKVYERRDSIKAPFKVDSAVDTFFYVLALERLEFVNSLTEQNRDYFLNHDVIDERFKNEVEKISQDFDNLASQFTTGGDSEEISEIASKSIKSMIAMAEEDIIVKDFISRLNDSDANFRYKHSQLIVFIGLQVLKNLNRNDEELESFSTAAFYHDICLHDDETASIRDYKTLIMNEFNNSDLDKIRNHAHDVHKLVKGLSNINDKTLAILLEHHQAEDGLGFGQSLKGLSYLSKAFIIVEHWVHLLMFENVNESEDFDKYSKQFKKLYKGKKEEEIIDTLFLIESVELIKSVTEDVTDELTQIKGTYNIDEAINLIKGLAPEDDTSQLVKGSNDKEESHQLVKGSKEKEDKSTSTIKGSAEDHGEGTYNIKGGDSENDASPGTMKVKSLEDETEQDTKNKPNINGEKLITAYISNSPELTQSIGGDWATAKFLSTLISLDNPLSKHPFAEKFNQLGLELKDSMESGLDPRTFSNSITDLSTEIRLKFEEDIKSTINNRDKAGRTKIMITIAATGFEMFKYILSFNPDLRLVDASGKTTLHYASLNGNLDIIDKILESNRGAIHKRDEKQRTPLFLAVTNDNIEVVKKLITSGAKPRMAAENDITTCMIAAKNGNLEILKALVENGEILSTQDKKFRNCLVYAKQGKNKEVLKYLKENGL
jgi:ankyrin repeat protein